MDKRLVIPQIISAKIPIEINEGGMRSSSASVEWTSQIRRAPCGGLARFAKKCHLLTPLSAGHIG